MGGKDWVGFLCGSGKGLGGSRGLCFGRYIGVMALESSSLFSLMFLGLILIVVAVSAYSFCQGVFCV